MKLLTFENEAEWLAHRHGYVTSTEVAALFGLSPYMTAFELATQKKQAAPCAFEGNERTLWGQRLQDAIAQGVADDHLVQIESMALTFAAHEEVRLGASFDYRIRAHANGGLVESELQRRAQVLGDGLLEVKNVDALEFRNKWLKGEAPAHIEIQLQAQLECAELPWGVIAALVGGNRTEFVVRERDPEVCAAIVAKVREFWKDLEKGIMPPPVMPQDAEVMIRLYSYAEPGEVYDGHKDEALARLCSDYRHASEELRQWNAEQMRCKASILQRIGKSERALTAGFKVSAAMVAPVLVKEHTRAAYRNLRVTEVA
jgi:putative phage-type endonuclease